MTLERETDRAIAAENKRFLSDPQAMAAARAEGDLYRQRIEAAERLAEIRQAIEAESVSYGELAELQSLEAFIDPSDTLLLEWAGVPEFHEDGEEVKCYACRLGKAQDEVPGWCGSCGALIDLDVVQLSDLYHAPDADCRTVAQWTGEPTQFVAVDHVLTQMPVQGLDDLTPADVEREIKGAIYKTRLLVERSHTPEAKEHAQRALDALIAHARAEGMEVDE